MIVKSVVHKKMIKWNPHLLKFYLKLLKLYHLLSSYLPLISPDFKQNVRRLL